MTLPLTGGGLREARAAWSTSAGTLSTATGTATTLTLPSQPGNVTVAYQHSLFADIQASATFQVVAPALSLVLNGPGIDLGETIEFTVKGVPGYLCSLLRTNLGEMNGCTLRYTPTSAGAQNVVVQLAGVPNSSVSIPVVPNTSYTLKQDGTGRVHGGLTTTLHAVKADGSAYRGTISWSATGGQVVGTGSDATFTAGGTTGPAVITTQSTIDPSQNTTVSLEVYLDPVVINAFRSNGNGVALPLTIISGDLLTFKALRPGGSVYPIPVTWTGTGGIVSDPVAVRTTYTAGTTAGLFKVSAQPTGHPELGADLPFEIKVELPVLTLADGSDPTAIKLLAGQSVVVEARTSTGQPYAGDLTWESDNNSRYIITTLNNRQVQITAANETGPATIYACLSNQVGYHQQCGNTSIQVMPLHLVASTAPGTAITTSFSAEFAAGQTVTLTTDGLSSFPTTLDWTIFDGSTTRQEQTPLGGHITVPGSIPMYFISVGVHVAEGGNPWRPTQTYLYFLSPEVKAFTYPDCSVCFEVARFGDETIIADPLIAPGTQWGLVAQPFQGSAGPVAWSADAGQIVPIDATHVQYTAPQAPGRYTVRADIVGFPMLSGNSYTNFTVAGPGLYLEATAVDATGQPVKAMLQSFYLGNYAYAQTFTTPFWPKVIGYPEDEVIWTVQNGSLQPQADGSLVLMANSGNSLDDVKLEGHLKNRPEVTVTLSFGTPY